MEVAATCYKLTQGFHKEEVYGITSQIRRAATSIPASIAEGYGRDGRGEFIQFLRIAQGSRKELETHLLLSVQLGFASHKTVKSLLEQCDAEGKQLHDSKPASEDGVAFSQLTTYNSLLTVFNGKLLQLFY